MTSNVSARSFFTSLARNISVCHFFLLVCSIFLKCRPAAANATVRLRERELRQAGVRRACLWPRLGGLSSPESLRGRARECRRRRSGWSVTSSSRLVLSSSSLCCRAIRFFAEDWRGGIRRFLYPRLESARALGWGCGLWRSKVPISHEKCVKMRPNFGTNFWIFRQNRS